MGKDKEDDNFIGPRKPKTTGFKRTSDRLRRGKENHLKHRASLDWRQDQKQVCDPERDTDSYVDLSELIGILKKSRTAEALFDNGGSGVLKIFYETQTPTSQIYPREDGCIITMNPRRPKGDLLNMLTRELRRCWQYRHGALVNPMHFEPDEAVLVNRAQQADALMVSIKVAWELKLIGEPEAWNFMTGAHTSDVTRTFELHAREDFRSLNNGAAARAAYDKFFEGNTTKIHDKHIIHQMLLDDSGYMKAAQKKMRVTMDLFSRLGEMPHSRNYLAAQSKRTPTDMCYSIIEDRSNANFLWFIKFERSFQEKELQMLSESVRLSAEIIDFAKWTAQSRMPKGREA